MEAIQDHYPEELAHCYGCGRMNRAGHQIKSRWDGEETVMVHVPRREQISIPGYVYGGLLASLIDCHGIGSAALEAHRRAGHEPDDEGPAPRYVTASLQVTFLRPTPLGPPIDLRGRIREFGDRKVWVDVSVTVEGVETVTGSVLAVRMPDSMASGGPQA